MKSIPWNHSKTGMMNPQTDSTWANDVTGRIIALRRRRRTSIGSLLALMLLLMSWSIYVTIIEDTDWERMGGVLEILSAFGRFAAIDVALLPQLLDPALETLMIACLGTFLGLLICVPAIWFGALNITPFPPLTYPLARMIMTLSRSVHEIVWALFFVAIFGLGAMAGVFAIAVRSVGFIAKMSAEAIENIDKKPVEAIQATGANGFQILRYAIVPQILPQVISVIIFEWEINIRRSAVLGLVGAGGLGLVFFRQMNTFNYAGVTSVILAILFIIVLGELGSHAIRRRLI